ncbi:hypothetical protein CQA15_29205, partial [Klebsiella pneumoniae]|uniref:hypothetical protein n=1 Tax=Klebsiella pneumoniae TaxID=573 RepID=UPI000BCD4F4D
AGNAILVRDRLSAAVPHTYEFNLHAPVIMTVESPSVVKIAINGQSVCVRQVWHLRNRRQRDPGARQVVGRRAAHLRVQPACAGDHDGGE